MDFCVLNYNYKKEGKISRPTLNKFTYLRYKHKAESDGAAEYDD